MAAGHGSQSYELPEESQAAIKAAATPRRAGPVINKKGGPC